MKITLKVDKLVNNVLVKAGASVDVHKMFSELWLKNGDAVKADEKKANKST
tara:strand:- start:3507 stop:3659 length:153 start_codon:yes stop_codon:yes gene_type:complete